MVLSQFEISGDMRSTMLGQIVLVLPLPVYAAFPPMIRKGISIGADLK